MKESDVAADAHANPARRRWRMTTLLMAALVAACGAESMVVASMATIINTEKLPSDYIAELATGLDCSTLRMQQDGGQLCRDPNAGRVFEKPVYCYRTLGQIDCYDRPAPYGASTRAVR